MPRRGWQAIEVPSGWYEVIRCPRPPAQKWPFAPSRQAAQQSRQPQSGPASGRQGGRWGPRRGVGSVVGRQEVRASPEVVLSSTRSRRLWRSWSTFRFGQFRFRPIPTSVNFWMGPKGWWGPKKERKKRRKRRQTSGKKTVWVGQSI